MLHRDGLVETVVIEHAIDITSRSGEVIIDADDIGTVREQTFAKVGAEKSSAPSYQHARFEMHNAQLLSRR
jgi:hypothetical protein